MAKTYKIAGQAAPAAATATDLYTVGVGKSFVSSSVVVCNRSTSGAPATYRIAVIPSGETLANKHYLAYEQILDNRQDKSKVLGITLSAGDKIVVYGSSANLSFTLFGCENS